MPNQDQSISLILVPLALGTGENDSPSRSRNTTMSDENPPVRIPEDEKGVHEIAEEEEDEDGVTEEQLRNIAEAQASLIGDL